MAIDYSCPEECVRDQVEALQAENAKLRAMAEISRARCRELARENRRLCAVVDFVKDDPERIRASIADSGGRGVSKGWNAQDGLALADALEALEDVR